MANQPVGISLNKFCCFISLLGQVLTVLAVLFTRWANF